MGQKLSVVICTFNRSKSLESTLKSLIKQTNSSFEVIIVDGGSTDKTNETVSRYSKKLDIKKHVYKEKELSKVRDLGWRKSKGKYVGWIDDDVVVDKNWAKNIVKALDEDKTTGGLTGPTIIPKKLLRNRDVFFFLNSPKGLWKIVALFWKWFFLENKPKAIGRLFKSGAWSPGSNFPQSAKIKDPIEVDYLEACNMTLRRSLIKKVKGFDYGYTGVAEWCELDLAIRVKNLGYKLIFDPTIKVEHHISQHGVFKRRTYAKQRMENFIRFYFSHIYKPKFSYTIKFTVYLLFLNLYWTYKAATEKNMGWLTGWIGTITGFLKIITERENEK